MPTTKTNIRTFFVDKTESIYKPCCIACEQCFSFVSSLSLSLSQIYLSTIYLSFGCSLFTCLHKKQQIESSERKWNIRLFHLLFLLRLVCSLSLREHSFTFQFAWWTIIILSLSLPLVNLSIVLQWLWWKSVSESTIWTINIGVEHWSSIKSAHDKQVEGERDVLAQRATMTKSICF